MTLLELLTVLSILAILGLAAVKTFEVPVLKTHQAAAKMDLLNLASALEQHFEKFKTYGGATLENLNYTPLSPDYIFTLKNLKATEYLIQAIPKKFSSADNCQVFFLDHAGNKTISGVGSVEECW